MRKLMLLFAFLSFLGMQVYAQKTVTGVVTSAEDGSTLPGVSVVVKGTSVGTVTDIEGKYTINVPEGATTLVFSFIGMKTLEMPISGNVVNASMEAEDVAIDEVVVTALGISREKKALGYAVTEVSGEDISRVKDPNVVNSLAGKVAGIVITTSTSGPGSGTRVIIRGNNSLNGNNQPLYVVDGIPVDNSGFGSAASSSTGEYLRMDYGTGISDLNPDDIESISVLKGPNAAALYGSRAANGVVLITTKKGKLGKGLGVTYSAQVTSESPLLLPEYQNEYGQGSNGEVYTDLATLKTHGGSWGPKMDGSQILQWTGETKPFVPQPDNVKNFFQDGLSVINTIAIDGGTQNSTVRFSYTNNKYNAIVPNSYFIRNNFNLRATTTIKDKLTLDAKVTYFNQFTNNRLSQGTEGIMAYLYGIPRNVDIEDLKDYQNEEDYSVNAPTASGGNPYWIIYNDINQDTRDRFQGFVKLTYKINDFLSIFGRVGTDKVNQHIEYVNKYGHWFYATGRLSFQDYKTSESNADFLLMFDKQFGDLHISMNAGANAMYQTFMYQGVRGEHFKIPTKYTLNNCQDLFPGYTPLRQKKIHSVYGNAQISFKNFLYLDISGRNDWSSTLPKDNWSYFYPSVSLSVLLNQFIDPDGKFLNLFKLRGSWAQVGSDTSPYQLDIAYNLNQNGYLGLTTLSKPSVRMNPDLKPEQTGSLEFGFDLSMLNNKLYANFSYYDIKSRDLIMDVPVAAATGYSYFRSNVGLMTNKGIELVVGGTPVKTKNFTWETSINFSKNKNELVELTEDLENYIFSTTNSGIVTVQATVGGGYGEIWGTTYMRDSVSGKIVVDANGRPMASAEKVLLGNYQPDFTAGFMNTFTFKGLTMSFLIDARIGGQLYSGTDASLDARGVSARTLQYREDGIVVDGVVNTGTAEDPVYETNTQKISAEQYWSSLAGIAEAHIYDQTNVRLREMSITYTLPKKLFDNIFIKDVSLGIVGRNLTFLYKKIDNFDPESSYSTSNFAQGVLYYNLPTTRSIGFNLKIKF